MTPFERKDIPFIIAAAVAVVVLMLVAIGYWG